MGIEPASLGIERMLCAGEPMPEATRMKLEELYRMPRLSTISAEQSPARGRECVKQKMGLHIIEPFFLGRNP